LQPDLQLDGVMRQVDQQGVESEAINNEEEAVADVHINTVNYIYITITCLF
jgi:hypothetical protein